MFAHVPIPSFAQVGQLVGNFMGLPFEFQYNNEPMPFEPKTYYDLGSARASGLRINTDGRGRIPQRLSQLQGGQKTSENMPVWPSGLIILDSGPNCLSFRPVGPLHTNNIY